MNKWWLIILVLSWLTCGYLAYHYEATSCKAADEKADIAGYQHKDEVITKQTAITQSEVSTYEKDSNAIGALYASGLSAPTVPNMSIIPGSTNGTCSDRSKQYKLSFKQCDIEEAKLKQLYDRDVKISVLH